MSLNSALKKILEAERDLLLGVMEVGDTEARYLTDTFYQMQEFRKATANQIRSMESSGERHLVIDSVLKHVGALEDLLKDRLGAYVETSRVGAWMLAQPGVGPVLAANMLAHLSVRPWKCRNAGAGTERCRPDAPCEGEHGCGYRTIHTAGAFWRFAGYDPTLQWNKGEKRPFNARLKTACWKLTDSWVKLGAREDALYAQLYRQRKALEVERNEAGLFADQAAAALERKRYGKTTEAFKAYSAGRLPAGQLDLRARRYAVKMFLSHLHWVMYEDEFGEPPPKPYVVSHLGHAHLIEPPGWAPAPALAAE